MAIEWELQRARGAACCRHGPACPVGERSDAGRRFRRRYLLTGGLLRSCWPQLSPFVRVRELSGGNKKKRKRPVPPLRRVRATDGRTLLGIEVSSVHVRRLESVDFLYGRFSTRAWDEAGFPDLDFSAR